MSSLDIKVYAMATQYTDEAIEGGGLKGKPCKIKSITDIEGGHRVTFSWTQDDGTEETSTMDVMDGVSMDIVVDGENIIFS